MKIIGIGNADRGDDAAGLLVVRRLRELGVEAQEHHGDALALMEAWGAGEDVVVIDAVVTGDVPGTPHLWDGRNLPPEAIGLRMSTHALSIGDAIRMAERMGRLPRTLTVYGIEGARFEPGSVPCGEVLQAIEELAQVLGGM